MANAREDFRKLSHLMADPVLIVDGECKILEVNYRITDVTADRKDELLGKLFSKMGVAGEEDVAKLKDVLAKYATGTAIGSQEARVTKRSGEEECMEINGVRIDYDGKPAVLVTFRDITQRKKLEEELKHYSEHLEELVAEKTRDLIQSQEKLRSVFAASPYPVTVTDLNGVIIDCNDQALKVYGGTTTKELIGKNILELIAEREHSRATEDMKHALDNDSLRNFEYTFLTIDGHEFPAELSASFIRDASGKPTAIVAIFEDITKRKGMEEQLLRSERLAVIGEVAAMVGHDLRNPLTGIAGATYYLKSKADLEKDEKNREMIEIIEKDIEHSNKIINDLLEYSREIRLDLIETTPRTLMIEALSAVKLPRNVIVSDSSMNEPKIEIDVDKMKRVFVNLINNAVEAMCNGGTLTITSRESDNNVEISVADTGVGMPKEVLSKLWTPLFTTKAKGMGLGLAICKRIVDEHAGTIIVESSVGAGTIFSVTIPKLKTEGGEKIWENRQESLLSTITRA